MNLNWNKPEDAPEDRTLSMIVINGKVAADAFVYFSKRGVFVTHSLYQDEVVENKVKLQEIDAWIALRELPLPAWVAGKA